ncbi:hypothetical protein EV122DRAFT_179364, partial [Schizophyllum commune]
SSYDYEEKYDEDAYGEELGPNARFWHVLLDEGRVYDADMVEGWRDTLDVLLVFRAWANGSPVSDVPRSHISLNAVSASKLDYWCNGLWYMSLALSLSVALMAVLVKQWLQAYQSHVSGTPKHQALIRQFRLIGVERWNLPLIVGLLPMLLHASLLLFFALVRSLPPSVQWTPRTREATAITRDETTLTIDSLSWVHATTSNPSAVSITVQAISGLPSTVADKPMSHEWMLNEILLRLEDPILHEGLLPHLLRMAFERFAGAGEVFDQQRISRSERQFFIDLHHDELKFLSSLAKTALSEEQVWDLFGTFMRLVKLPLWRLEVRADLLDVYQRRESTPPWAARPLLQSLVHLLSTPPREDRAHVRGVNSTLRHIAIIFERCPKEALEATIEDDILLALKPYV